jgi:hypothetical protein
MGLILSTYAHDTWYVNHNRYAMMVVHFMVQMNITLSGITKLENNLEQLRSVIKTGLKPELQKAGQWYMDFLQNDVFGTEGGVYGKSWQPINQKYAKKKAQKYPGHGVLERTGKLKKS